MFEIGQEVYYYNQKKYRNLKIIKIDGFNIICEGESYHENEKSYKDGWHKQDYISFYIWEIKDTPFEDGARLHNKCKWDKIINKTTNMSSTLSYMYKEYLTGDLNLSPSYQRGLVWTLEQKQSYIMALFEEKATISPTIILNWTIYRDGCGRFEVVDGVQRLSTVFDFMENKFCLSDGTYFKDLPSGDHSFFVRQYVRYTRIEKLGRTDLTINEKIQLFLEINELGTKMSDEHIQRVKEMIE